MKHFFEGVEARVAQGIREEEVSYQLAFNKQELRKVIKEYPGKEVKKGLDNLYKKVDKHLCEEENLLQVCLVFLIILDCTFFYIFFPKYSFRNATDFIILVQEGSTDQIKEFKERNEQHLYKLYVAVSAYFIFLVYCFEALNFFLLFEDGFWWGFCSCYCFFDLRRVIK